MRSSHAVRSIAHPLLPHLLLSFSSSPSLALSLSSHSSSNPRVLQMLLFYSILIHQRTPQLGSTLKKLEEVRREKSQLLKQIEHEKSHHSNLQTELEGIQSTSTEDDAAAAPPVTAKTSTALSAGSSSLLTMGTLTEDLEEDEEEDDGCGEMVDLPDLAGIQS